MKSIINESIEKLTVSTKMTIGKYEVILLIEKSKLGYENGVVKAFISVYRNENNVTYDIFDKSELVSEELAIGNEQNLLKAIDTCRNKE